MKAFNNFFKGMPDASKVLALVYILAILVSIASLIWAWGTGQIDINNW